MLLQFILLANIFISTQYVKYSIFLNGIGQTEVTKVENIELFELDYTRKRRQKVMSYNL